ncbi:lipid A export ATP-bindingpermease protein [Nitrosomonas stercoris]|uniref:Lipid A export ATP-bindingpermease protein n=1 Tax=Nitrosomonas stercoris TaxID=1444684 RepID=A0A4Y1YJ23_9PROT|nr:lipid A export ATP-bindingpermease protein [Nitrosomonas stercoris]
MPDEFFVLQMNLLKYFLHFLSQNKFGWVFLMLIAVAGCVIALVIAVIPLMAAQFLIQVVLPDGNQQLLVSFTLMLALFVLVIIAANWLSHYLLHRLLSKFLLQVRTEIFKKLLEQPSSGYISFSAHKISAYFSKYMEKLYCDIAAIGNCMTQDAFIVIGLFAVMIWLSPDVSVLVFTLLLIVFLVKQIFNVDIYQREQLNRKQHEIYGSMASVLHHSRMVYLDQGIKQEIRYIRNMLKQFQNILLKQAYQTKLLKLLSVVFLVSASAGIFYYLLQQLTLNLLPAEDVIAFVVAGLMLVYPLKQLLSVNLPLKNCDAALRAVFAQLGLDTQTVIEDTPTPYIKTVKGKLRFEGVSYKDDDHLKLSCFDLEIALGERVALINSDACVNTLLADLVCGFKQPTTGRILLDNIDISQVDHVVLNNNIAWVAPDKNLLNDTVAANIAYGNLRCSSEIAITTAAHTSQAMEFIRDLPHGLQTKLGYDYSLSDDQRQRILIARALLKRPKIVILDERSGYFDVSHPFLLQALHTLLNNRIVLIISARSVLQQFADQSLDPANLNLSFSTDSNSAVGR